MQLPKASFFLILLGLFVLIASYVAFIYPSLNTIFFLVIIILVLIGGLIKTEFAAAATLLELCLGGHGYMFSIPIGNFSLSLRVALFSVLIICWMLWRFRIRAMPNILQKKLFFPLLLFCCILLVGFIYGIFTNGYRLSFFDANAYLAILYIPVFYDVWRSTLSKRRLFTILTSGAVTLGITTIALLAIFSVFHYDSSLKGSVSVDEKVLSELANPGSTASILLQRTNVPPEKLVLHAEEVTKTKPISYRWLRDTGIGQISYISGKFFRVFLPSHILLAAFFCFYSVFAFFVSRKQLILWASTWLLLAATVIISFSRSLWLGCFFAALLGVSVLIHRIARKGKHKALSFTAILFASAIFFIFLFSIPAIKNRVTTVFTPQKEVAATHRIELLKAIYAKWKQHPLIGSGFGTTVTFPTVFPNGQVAQITFYVYEWAFFDTAVKIGTVGLGLFFIICIWIPIQAIKLFLKKNSPELLGAALAATMLIAANITTPVLIHPLGLSMLAVCYLITTKNDNGKSPTASSHME